ncbi:MAG: hypothetical protein Q4B01_10635 [Eubacteriales bacterium]|nr:hypothetical protein [Eubacteriales bacterium]
MNNKLDEILARLKVQEMREDRKHNPIICGLAIIGLIVGVAAIAYAVYRFLTPDYFEDEDDADVTVVEEKEEAAAEESKEEE